MFPCVLGHALTLSVFLIMPSYVRPVVVDPQASAYVQSHSAMFVSCVFCPPVDRNVNGLVYLCVSFSGVQFQHLVADCAASGSACMNVLLAALSACDHCSQSIAHAWNHYNYDTRQKGTRQNYLSYHPPDQRRHPGSSQTRICHPSDSSYLSSHRRIS